MDLYDRNGHRKYLTPDERRDFLKACESAPREVRTFCGTLAHTGCRISEALALTADRADMKEEVLVFESLKKRRKGVFRAVPTPPDFLDTLNLVHDLRTLHGNPDRGRGVALWDWSRATAWRRVCEVMEAAGVTGLHASPKGLRHGFGVHAVSSDVPLNMVQKWLGHAQLSTTAIYTNAVGAEEKKIAKRMWGK
jgi:integrase/recombinase XerD